MTGASLREHCQSGSAALDEAGALAARASLSNGPLSALYDQARLANDLHRCEVLLEARSVALAEMGALDVKADGFPHRRLLRLQAYLAVTWSVYDIAIRVVASVSNPERVRERSFPPKLFDLLSDESFLGARMSRILREHYGWPIAFATKLRNCTVHDGGGIEDADLFATSDGLLVHGNAVAALERACVLPKKEEKPRAITRAQARWPSTAIDDCGQNLVALLGRYHAEVDEAVGFLVDWSTASFSRQATLFLDRDVGTR